ncbi:MAG: hypothetical protein ACI9SY_000766 [Candidatus Paceibacteria bacterium]|jgi:hypothetical protein
MIYYRVSEYLENSVIGLYWLRGQSKQFGSKKQNV